MRAFQAWKHKLNGARLCLIILLFIKGPVSIFAQGHFAFNSDIQSIYQRVIDLRLDEARQSIAKIKPFQQNNLALDFIEDYIDFLKAYLSEDPKLIKSLAPQVEARMEKLVRAGPKDSPYTRYVMAEIHLHWALVQVKAGHYLTSFGKIKKAHQLLQDNVKQFPQFIPNFKSLGIIHAMMSAIPDELKWIVKTLSGLQGTMDQAKFELEQVMLYADRNAYMFHTETMVVYGLIMANFENDVTSAWTLIRKCNLDPTTSPLVAYIFTHLAIKNGENDLAIKYLSQKPNGAAFYPFPFLDFLLGVAKLRRLDADANIFLSKFVINFKGKHYIKECYQKLAWSELIRHNKQGYTDYMLKVNRMGVAVVDEDKQAQHEAQSKQLPNDILLKARLLSDGGYHLAAEKLLLGHEGVMQPSQPYHTEALYRIARIYHLQNKYDQAIVNYMKVVNQGKNKSGHYICAAYLYTGQIYESLQNSKLAKYYFEKCLNENPSDYGTSLHQKAKIGLNRIRN